MTRFYNTTLAGLATAIATIAPALTVPCGAAFAASGAASAPLGLALQIAPITPSALPLDGRRAPIPAAAPTLAPSRIIPSYSYTCPPNAAESGLAQQSPGWSVLTAWAPFSEVTTKNLSSGTSIVCHYGISPAMPSLPDVTFSLSRNLGAGISASKCTVTGDTVTCAGGVSMTCPIRHAEVVGAREDPAFLAFTPYPEKLASATVSDPASMNAGASFSCGYGPTNTHPSSGDVLTLERNADRGVTAANCKIANATRTVSCSTPGVALK